MVRQAWPACFWIGIAVATICVFAVRAANALASSHEANRGNTITVETARPAPASRNFTRLTESGISPKAMRLYLRAVRELHKGQAARSEKDALRALQLDPKFADADALAATAALKQRRFLRAEAEAKHAVRIDANDEKAWVVLATADNYLGKYAEGEAALKHVTREDRSTWQVGYQWARAEAGQGHVQQALEWANRAAVTAPAGFVPLHLLRASTLLAANEYAQAADQLAAYLQLMDAQSTGANPPQRAALTYELQRLREMAKHGPLEKPVAVGAQRSALSK